jgi:hypothetical protein
MYLALLRFGEKCRRTAEYGYRKLSEFYRRPWDMTNNPHG